MEQALQAPWDAFTAPGRWYRGNLHTHTTGSDGLLSPAEVAAWYHGHGYDFLAITDHRTLTGVAGLSLPGFLVLPGMEAHPGQSALGELWHLVAAGVSESHTFDEETPVQQAIDELRADGGVVWLAHPYWSGLTLPEMLGLEGTIGCEVYNATCTTVGKGLSTVHWDDLLARGRVPWGLAVDDAHWEHADYGRGWVMVRAEELSAEAILRALTAGRFYASQGPAIYGLEVTESEIHVRCSEVGAITCVSLAGRGGQVLAEGPNGRLTEATFPRRGKKLYVRIECADAQGRTAWSQPVLLD